MPTYSIGDKVMVTGPFADGLTYTVLRIQYLNEIGEFVEGPSERWQYEIAATTTSSVEDYLEAAV